MACNENVSYNNVTPCPVMIRAWTELWMEWSFETAKTVGNF